MARNNFQVAEQACPGRRIGLRDRRQLGPRKVRLDCGNIGDGSDGVLGVAAVDRTAQPSHEGSHFCARCEFAAGTGFDHAHTFDATDVGDLGPLPFPHMQLGMIETEGFDLNHDMPLLRFGLRNLPDLQHVRAAELFPQNRSHRIVLPSFCHGRPSR